jgi:hypothetical protein
MLTVTYLAIDTIRGMPVLKTAQLQLNQEGNGCEHSQFEVPSRMVGNLQCGLCAACKNQIALELDEMGKPTGNSWLVAF